jgi:RNA polymerase sigma-70 factor (ECF subfamily)
VYEEHFDFVWRFVTHRGVPRSAVDDVVQEVFIVVHRKLGTFEGRSSLRTWLSMIARRVARDHVKKRGNTPVGEPLGDNEPSATENPAEALEQKRAARLLAGLLGKMSEIQRDVFVLHEMEQMTGAEIAEALGVNENTVHTRLRAARQIFEAGVTRARAEEMRARSWTR